MFHKIAIKNFKSLANVEVELGPFTVLVGDNGSGKSSFLQAIELASWAVKYNSINDALADHQIDFRDLVFLRSSKKSIEITTEVASANPRVEDVCQSMRVSMTFEKRKCVCI